MGNLELSNYFKNEYLTAGNTYDNYLFINCPSEVLNYAEKSLKIKQGITKPCNISLTRADEERIELVLKDCQNDFVRKILIRDFVTSLILKEVFRGNSRLVHDYNKMVDNVNMFYFGDLLRIKNECLSAPFPFEIANFSRKYGKIELNIFLRNTQNKEIQQAINNLIFSREPYSIKVFTNSSRLPAYTTQNGEFIENPHDYTLIDMSTDRYYKTDDPIM